MESENTSRIAAICEDIPAIEIADFLTTLEPNDRLNIFNAISDSQKSGTILVDTHESIHEQITPHLKVEELIPIVKDLQTDDAAYLLHSLHSHKQNEILESLSDDQKLEILEVLSYPQDTAGSLMQSIHLSLTPDTTVRTVLRFLRDYGPLPNNINTIYCVDDLNQLLGEIHINELISLKPDDVVASCLKKEFVSIDASMDQEDVARLFQKYSLITAPVVSKHNKLLGRITVDDVIDVIKEEADEDLLSMGGVKGSEDLFGSVYSMSAKRFSWIGINLVMVLMASAVIHIFDSTIERLVALAVLMPIVVNMGGNLGNQTLTAVVRALALDHIQDHNKWVLISKQIGIGFLSGLFWGLIVGSVSWLWFQDPSLSLVMASSMFITLQLATILGAIIPLSLEKFKIDPALAGGIILTASTDIIGFLVLLGLASMFLIS